MYTNVACVSPCIFRWNNTKKCSWSNPPHLWYDSFALYILSESASGTAMRVSGTKQGMFDVNYGICSLSLIERDKVGLCEWVLGKADRLNIYDIEGNCLKEITLPSNCKTWSLTIDKDNIIVSDYANKCLQVLKSSGQLQRTIPMQHEPHGLSNDGEAVWLASEEDSGRLLLSRLTFENAHLVSRQNVTLDGEYKFWEMTADVG